MNDPILSTSQLVSDGATPTAPKTITLKIPQFNIQAVILGLLAIVTIFQAFQLYTLKSGVANLSVKPAAAATTGGSSAPASNSGALPEMVGGC